MDNLKIFQNQQFNAVRTVIKNSEPWFIAVDVCKILNLENSRKAVEKLDDDEKGVTIIDTNGGKQKATIISESGLYSLILTSRKPEAKEFKRWITHEVIPSIRKHGAYATATTIESIIADPESGIKLLQALKNERDIKRALQEN